jgi:hypothetical protein
MKLIPLALLSYALIILFILVVYYTLPRSILQKLFYIITVSTFKKEYPYLVRAYLLSILFILYSMLPYFLGQYFSTTTRPFLIFHKYGKYFAVVKVYNGSIIALAVDRKSNTLKNDILIIHDDQPIAGSTKILNPNIIEQ